MQARRSTRLMFGAITTIGSLLASTASADTNNFEAARTGEAPAGWTCTKTGSGNPKWAVVGDDSAPSKPNVFKVGVWTKADSVTLFDDFVHGAK